MKKALLLCASHNDLGLIKSLIKLGFYIVVTGNIKGLPGERYVDKHILADYSDKDLILKIAEEEKIECIITNCNDYGVYTASYVAERLKLPGHDSYETILQLHNKDKFNDFAKKHGISSPASKNFEDIQKADKFLKNCDYPIIIKPVDASAGNGINRANNFNEASKFLKLAFEKSKAGRIVIEPFITGSQHGFCTFLRDKKVVLCCSNNEYSIINPYRVEIDTFPSDDFEENRDKLIYQVEQIAEILNLKDGIFHMQYIIQNNKIYIIEVMRRVLGNLYFVPANLNIRGGADFEYWETRARCGFSCQELPPALKSQGFHAYKCVLANHNGIIKNIVIPKNYDKYLIGEYWLKKIGDTVSNYKSDPVGFLFFMFRSQEEMHRVLIDEYRTDLVITEAASI